MSECPIDGFPESGASQRELSRLLEEGLRDQWHLPVKDCPTGQRLLTQPRDQQVSVLLATLTRSLWELSARGPQAVAGLFLLRELSKELLRRKLPFRPEELAVAVSLICDISGAKELGGAMLRQLAWHEKLTEPVRDSLVRLRRVFEALGRSQQADRAGQLLSRSYSPAPSDEHSEASKRRWQRLLNHARRAPRTLSKRWRRKAQALAREVGEEAIPSRLLPWLEPRLDRLSKEEPRLLAGIICLCGELAEPKVVPWLERVAKWGYRPQQGHGPRAARLANCSLDSLGRIAKPDAVARLVALEGELGYPSARKQVAKALLAAAQVRSLSTREIREKGVGDPAPSSEIGKRLARRYRQRLESSLRAGASLTGASWSRLCWSNRVLRELSSSLLWQSEGLVCLGAQELGECDHLRLWHPAETSPEEATRWTKQLARKRVRQPFPQAHREVYDLLPGRDSPPLCQRQFAALARGRGWQVTLAHHGSRATSATLQLGQVAVSVFVKPVAKSRTRSGIADRVTLCPPSITGSKPLPRHTSEIVRDWNLFCRVARRLKA